MDVPRRHALASPPRRPLYWNFACEMRPERCAPPCRPPATATYAEVARVRAACERVERRVDALERLVRTPRASPSVTSVACGRSTYLFL